MVWQYKVHREYIQIPKSIQNSNIDKEKFHQEMWADQLNKLGIDGWDLINYTREWQGSQILYVFYLKRAMRRKA